MKFSNYITDMIYSLTSYLDAVKRSRTSKSLAEDDSSVNPHDLDDGYDKSTHGSFEGLPAFSTNGNALDHQDEFYDAIQDAPDADLTKYEANNYLKNILKVDLNPTNKSTIINADRDVYQRAYYPNHQQP
jgi:hypothetical protein